ncbi:Exocyst complex component EXO84A [Morella rubra]|uniref:Exocyst complex component EXO84A n=1 Tax=Morella rubra TaxID=262757 RepID=A0A6A1V7V2_9ROSI|nr:Exocyst complex component EXO84A [Morella rubra]
MDSSRLSSVSFSSSVEDSTSEQDANITLSDRLKVFKTNNFDPNAYVTSKCQTMNEKVPLSLSLAASMGSEIRHLFSYLVDLRKASAEEMRRSVYANYAAFIRTSREISNLEGQLLSMRNLLSTRAALVHGLAEGVHIYSVSSGPEDSAAEDVLNENEELSKMENWLIEFLDMLEVLLAERRVNEALAALDEAETVAEEASEKQTLSQTTLLSLQTAIIENRLKLADQLAETICQPSTRGVELRTAVLALKRLGDGPRAHTLLLDCHQQKLQGNMHSLRPSHASYGAAYTVTLSQLVFSTIAQAAKDSFSLFADESAYASELVTWAVRQTEAFGLLLKRHVLASSAAAGGLRVTAECFHVCLAHCSLLEARGLALSLVLLKLFRPCIEQALDANLKRIEQSSAALVASEDWLLAYPATGTRLVSTTCLGGANASQPKLSSSAQRFNAMVQVIFYPL